MAAVRTVLDERFEGDVLDTATWLPYYLPHWSSRAASGATYVVDRGELRLTIPADQPLWCADVHPEPLRVSVIQSGCFAGPLGSTIGQQPFRDGLVVREEQRGMSGYTPLYGHIEVRMRAVVTARSMFAFWMSGIEDQPERSGEICVAEVFGSGIHDRIVEVGMGIHRFRDPALEEEFAAAPLAIDVTDAHTYGVDWLPGSVTFSVDGQVVRRLGQAPDYPMQLMLGVFDFPGRAADAPANAVPELVVSHVRGHPLA
jgi:hypothetical protein